MNVRALMTVGLLVLSMAVHAEVAKQSFAECAAVDNASPRLDCYDGLAGGLVPNAKEAPLSPMGQAVAACAVITGRRARLNCHDKAAEQWVPQGVALRRDFYATTGRWQKQPSDQRLMIPIT